MKIVPVLSLVFLLGVTFVRAEYWCYQCVSSSDNQEDCEESDLEKLKKFHKVCIRLEEGSFKGAKAKGCRKIIQTVESKRSIIRECAYSGDVVDGQKKTGNWGINMYYYQCVNTGDEPCNGTWSASLTAPLLLVIATMLLFN
ncbi:hypothetical protein KIN20_023473 [Parelaphostrongylus tenuis]|uniref:Protein sleepless n=1 Tax=Parelaphostrongylus tenuis TaxID=148309 RepID=A0AAD5NA49_PARTN|nr:hypothetical protein KIN20_023473 [Parelaphostrongylus tenuis]